MPDDANRYRLELLGPLVLSRAGQPVALGTHKLAALLTLLALDGPLPRARAAAWLWPGVDDAAARRNLRRELARLRDAGAGDVLAAGETAVLALAPGVACDAHELATALAGDDATALAAALVAALAKGQGRLADGLRLDDCPAFAEWLDAARSRLQAQRRGALQTLADAAIAAGDDAAAVRWLEGLLADDPLHEAAHRQLMQQHLRAGRRAAALAQYARCQAALARELGVAPGAATEALARQARAEPAQAAPAPALPTAARGPGPLPLVGRDADWQRLQQAWAAQRPMLIEGEAGVGKTRLASEFAAAQGAYALAQCRPGDAATPYAAFKRVLRLLAGPALDASALPGWIGAELAHVLPELGTAAARSATAEDRSRLHEAALAAWQHLASGSFDAVLVDDWHLADADSRELFVALALAPRGAEAPRLLLLLRPVSDASMQQALSTLDAAGALHLVLPPLDEASVFALVQRLSGAEAPWRFTRRLLAATGGNPFFVAETLAHWQGLGLLTRGDDGQWRTPFDEDTEAYVELPLPASVRDAVLARLRRQGEPLRRLLEAAALASEPFKPQLLAHACAMPEAEALAAIEDGLAAGLLRELGDGHAFAHDLMQAAVASTLTPERARLVHRRLALGAVTAGLEDAEIAQHWESGGEPRRAVPHRLAAGEHAALLGSWQAAEAHWAAALADDPTPEQHLEVLRKRWPTLQARDDRPGLQQLLDELERLHGLWRQQPASARAAVGARVEQALILSLEMQLRAERSTLELADEVQPALAPNDPLQAELALARAQTLNNHGRHDEAHAVVEAALQQPGVPPTMQARLLHTLVFGLFHVGQPQRALPYAQRVVHIRRAGGDRRAQLRALANLGLVQSAIGNQQAARAAMEEALQLARELRLLDPQRELSNNLADIHLTEGRPAEAMALAEQALALAPHWVRPGLRVLLLDMRVQAAWQLGALGEARNAADTALQAALDMGKADANYLVDTLSMSLDLFAFVGDFAEARRRVALLQAHPGKRSRHFEVKLAFNRVLLALDEGDLAAAEAAMAEIGDPQALQEQRDREHAVLCRAALCRAQGDADAARGWLDRHPAPQAHVEVAARRALLRLQLRRPQEGEVLAQARDAAADARTPRPIALLLRQALCEAEGPQPHAAAAAALRAQLLGSLARAPGWQARLAERLGDEPGSG